MPDERGGGRLLRRGDRRQGIYDRGALLARHLPAGLAGLAADLGAGWGYLSAELLARCPGITALDLYEAEARALALALSGLRRFAGTDPCASLQ